MLYVCIPVHNEAETAGLVLWRIRKVFQDYPREYEVLVFDDGSTDATAETLAPYAKVLPLTMLGGRRERVGYAAAVEALLREAAARTRYPRRDAIVLMQGDFTDQPEHLPELVKRFEGGADVVVAEYAPTPRVPTPVRRLRWLADWAIRPFLGMPGVKDPFGTLRLLRVSVVRDLLKQAGAAAPASGARWAANVELLRRAAGHARRVETVALEPRYDVRPRESRIRPLADARALLRYALGTRRRLPGTNST